MSRYLIHQINETPNIHVLLTSKVIEVNGENRLESITLIHTQTGQLETFPTSGLYIFIGAVPHTDGVAGLIQRDANGFVLTGPDLMQNGRERPQGWTLDRQPYLLETNVPGIFAVGDVRHGSTKRVAAGVGEGSIAVQLVHQYLTRV
jgi:thioredoxin reductase (NADPH)